MKRYPYRPGEFDGSKFAARYGLSTDYRQPDFWADEDYIYIREGIILRDDPPIFEAPDPPGPSLVSRIEALSGDVSTDMKAILLELAKGR